jgi:hypothetical protein
MAGRKRINIDWKRVDRLLEAGCMGTEIASAIGVHYDTLVKRCKIDNKLDFSEYLRQKRETGDSILRVAQFKSATSGNTTMLIWLGKQRLNQSDKSQSEQDNSKDLISGLAALVDKARGDYEA